MDHFYTKLYDTNKPLLTIVDDFGNVFFNASDAAKILGYGNRSQKVIAERISEDCKVHLDEIKVNIEKENYDKRKYKNNSIFLRECGLYELTLGSNKEMATEFKKWITHDLLPELRAKSEYFISERIKFIDGNPNEAEITIKDLKDENQKLGKELRSAILEVFYHRKNIKGIVPGKKGYIYVLKVNNATLYGEEKPDCYKPGSTGDINARIKEYKTGNPKVELLVYFPVNDVDVKDLEKALKLLLHGKELREGNEIYCDTSLDEITATIKQLIQIKQKLFNKSEYIAEENVLKKELEKT